VHKNIKHTEQKKLSVEGYDNALSKDFAKTSSFWLTLI